MNEKRKNLSNERKVLKVMLIVVIFFILGLAFASVKENNSLQMGTAISPEMLETRWSQEYKLCLPGMVGKLNINTADQEDLEALPGVGEKIAQEIIFYREENGLFQTTDEIVKVSGIGIKKLDQMKGFIIVK